MIIFEKFSLKVEPRGSLFGECLAGRVLFDLKALIIN
jgi:hypothetical protein